MANKRRAKNTANRQSNNRPASNNRQRARTAQSNAKSDTAEKPFKSSYSNAMARFKDLANTYGYLGTDAVYNAFMRAGYGMANQPQIQNSRIKAISTLPVDYTKEQLGGFLQKPSMYEKELRSTSEILRWTSYPYFKITKTYADILTYKHYSIPLYLDKEDVKEKDFLREARLVDKINKSLNPEAFAHKAAGQAATSGKVFYILRHSVDKIHNKVNYVFTQRLPQDYCAIIGFNNITGYTISFDMMYFLQMGTDYRQYGDLFEPYIDTFSSIVSGGTSNRDSKKYVYSVRAKRGNEYINLNYQIDEEKFRKNNIHETAGNPRLFSQDGRWCYYVSLPIDKVWTYEIDDSTVFVAPTLSGLMQTFAQQSDYEAAQLSLILNPLIKIFTGEIPYTSATGSKEDDGYRLSQESRLMFEAWWNELMAATNTSGTAFFTAPVDNIKSHDYAESANANTISSEFNKYGMEKAGLTALIPATDNPHQGMAQYSGYLESRYADRIYRTTENMINHLYEELNLKYDWKFNMFGSIYTDSQTRADAEKALDKGDLFAWIKLAALDGVSFMDKLSVSYMIKGTDYLDYLIPPQTAYTQSGNSGKGNSGSNADGAPTKTEQQVTEGQTITKREEIATTNGE